MGASPGPDMLAAKDVYVNLGATAVLKGVTFETRPGEIAGLIGPNGAGKTTMLRVLAGLLRPNAGQVRLGATPLKNLNAGERAQRIAFMPQHYAAHPFTALETVLMARYAHLGRFELEGKRDRKIAQEAMARTDTARFESRQLDRLSGGERQRVVLARAIAQQAGVILLDEPSSSLDLRHRLSVMEMLKAEAAGRSVSVVVAMHDVALAGRYCDRLAMLSDGSIVAEGRPGDVLTPDNFREVFGVETRVDVDPATGCPQVWLIGPASQPGDGNDPGYGDDMEVA